MKPLELTEKEWADIYNKLANMYKEQPSMLLIRTKMRRELGFTPRHQKKWIQSKTGRWLVDEKIVIDFFNEPAESWFRLTFL